MQYLKLRERGCAATPAAAQLLQTGGEKEGERGDQVQNGLGRRGGSVRDLYLRLRVQHSTVVRQGQLLHVGGGNVGVSEETRYIMDWESAAGA